MRKGYIKGNNDKIARELDILRNDVGACCALLVDVMGNTLFKSGEQEPFHIEEISALLSGSVSALVEAGKLLKDEQHKFSLIYYREGSQYNLFGINIGEKVLLTMLIPKTKFVTHMGAIIHFSQRTAKILENLLENLDFSQSPADLPKDLDNQISKKLEGLFNLGE